MKPRFVKIVGGFYEGKRGLWIDNVIDFEIMETTGFCTACHFHAALVIVDDQPRVIKFDALLEVN